MSHNLGCVLGHMSMFVILAIGNLSYMANPSHELKQRVTHIKDITTIHQWPAGKMGSLPEPLANFVEKQAEELAKEPGIEAAYGRDLKASSFLGSHIAVDMCPKKRLWLLRPYFGTTLDPSYFPTVYVATEALPEGTCSQPIAVDMRFVGISDSDAIPIEIIPIGGNRCPLVAVSIVEHPGSDLYTAYKVFLSVESKIEPEVVFAYVDRENNAGGPCPCEVESIVRNVREIARDQLLVTVNAVLRNGNEMNLGWVRYGRSQKTHVYVPTDLEAGPGISPACLVSANGESYESILQRIEGHTKSNAGCH